MPLAYLLAVIIPPTLMIYPAVVLPSTAAIDAIGSTMGGILMVTARWRRFQGRSWWPFAIAICVVWLVTVIAMGVNGDPASVWPGGTTWLLVLLSAMIVTTIDRWTVPEFSPLPTGTVLFAIALAGVGLFSPMLNGLRPGLGMLPLVFAMTSAAWGVSFLQRAQRRRLRAERIVVRDRERKQMARELHDVIAHEVIGIVVLAQGVRDSTADPMARQALERIEGAGGRALEGIRAIVTASREDEEPTAPATAPHYQSLDDVARLVDDFAHTTTASPSLTRRGEAPVATPIAAAAYRIVAESLNNVHRHAVEPQAIEVLLDTSGAALVIEVTDDGHDPYDDTDRTGSPGGGWGLEGIAERADLVGGHVQTGPLPQGGWRVRAVLPMEGPGPASSTLTPRAPSEPRGAI